MRTFNIIVQNVADYDSSIDYIEKAIWPLRKFQKMLNFLKVQYLYVKVQEKIKEENLSPLDKVHFEIMLNTKWYFQSLGEKR